MLRQAHLPTGRRPLTGSNPSPPCTFATSCCKRHPISCRDISQLRLAAPPAEGQECIGAPIYTRPGRVGSKYTTQYLANADSSQPCAQWGAFHDVLASALPAHQRKVTVIREPCSRAHSLLAHWHREFPASHPIQRITTLPQLATFLRQNWASVTKRPWPERDLRLHHYIVGWPQAWYVDGCTRVLCFERISQELPAFCTARGGGSNGIGGGNTHNVSRARTADEAGCADIRRLYAEDAALHDRHCVRAESDSGAAGSSISTSAHSAPSSVAVAPEVSSRLPPHASCLLYTSPSPRDRQKSRMPSSA